MHLEPDLGDFHYRDGELHCESVPVATVAAEYGTPLYVYSRAAMEQRYHLLRDAFGRDARICYAVKSNSNLSILKLFADLGAGFDLVSGGELRRLLAAGVSTADAVFAGVAKADWEVEEALAAGILLFNLESEYEVPLLEELGRKLDRPVDVAMRLNVDVDAASHEFISTGRRKDKFGLGFDRAAVTAETVAGCPHVRLVGYHVHLGSLLRSIDPYLEALDRVYEFMDRAEVRREGLEFYDCGGGFGISYGDGRGILDVAALGRAMLPRLAERGLTPILEPGRFLVADAGVLVTEVMGVKGSLDRRFVIVDGAMNDLLRPVLYGANHPIAPLRAPAGDATTTPCDVVGPVCESGDFLAKGRELTPVERGDRLAVFAAGAYGFSMASNYNSRRRPAEVLVSGDRVDLIRRREDFEELWGPETIPR